MYCVSWYSVDHMYCVSWYREGHMYYISICGTEKVICIVFRGKEGKYREGHMYCVSWF